MKIKYKQNNTCHTNGLVFTKQEIKEVNSEIGKYLLDTFPNEFEEIKETKTVEKPKQEIKTETKPKTTRAKSTKAQENKDTKETK